MLFLALLLDEASLFVKEIGQNLIIIFTKFWYFYMTLYGF